MIDITFMSSRPDPVAGKAIRERAQGEKADALARQLQALDPDLLDWSDGFIFGQVWNRPGLDFERRMLVAISALAALGQIPQLRNYLHGALQAGIAPETVRETLAMTCVYAGFPAGLNALECWRTVQAAHAQRQDPA
jgi:4-carboxymuconolactone decarboxylase